MSRNTCANTYSYMKIAVGASKKNDQNNFNKKPNCHDQNSSTRISEMVQLVECVPSVVMSTYEQ